MKEGTLLCQWKSYLPKWLILSRYMHFFSPSAPHEEGIWYYRNAVPRWYSTGLPCLLSSTEPELLSIIIYLFRLWSWYSDWSAKAEQMNMESPIYSGRFKLERCNIFAYSMLWNLLKFNVLLFRNKIRHSQKQNQSCLQNTLQHRKFKNMIEYARKSLPLQLVELHSLITKV